MKANSPMGKRYCADLLTKLVDIPSVFPQEEEVMLFLERELTTLGMRPERIEVTQGRFNLLCRIGSGSPRICLNAHADTVTPNGESTPGARIDGDTLYGLGACDDKASVAAIITAGLEIASRADEIGGVDVLVSVDEEDGGTGVETAIKKGYACDYAIVGEPSDLDVVRAHNGLTWLMLTAKGVAAHGSAPWAGVNAIERMMEVVEELKAAITAFPPHPITGPMSLNLGIIKGGDLPNRVPESCEAVVDIRIPPPTRLQDVHKAIQPIFDSRDWISYTGGKKSRNGLDTPEDSPLIEAVLAAGRELDRDTKVIGGRGWTEAESFRTLLGIDAVVCGPGSMKQAHSSREFVSISETQHAAELYVRTVEKLINSCVGGQQDK